jgi:hypothetical protein
LLLSRRDLLKLGVGAIVCGSTPDLAKGATPSALPCDPLQLCTKNLRWTNKHENVSLAVECLYQPLNRTSDCLRLPKGHEWEAGLASLKAILAEAERQSKRVRAVGATWSLSKAATCPDFMIDTTALNYLAPISPDHVLSGGALSADHLFFAERHETSRKWRPRWDSNPRPPD